MSTTPRYGVAPTRLLPRSGGAAAVLFVAASIVALAVVPAAMDRRAAGALAEITDVLDPARLLGTQLSLAQARQMSTFQAFLLTGNAAFREPYLSALREEEAIVGELQSLIGGMDLQIRERLAHLSSLSARWHAEHHQIFQTEEARVERVEAFAEERARYEELQRAALELERAIQAELNAGRRRSDVLHRGQRLITVVLLVLGLGATAAVVAVGSRLRELTRDADARRRDAVLARREMDAILDATGDGVLGMDLDGAVVSLNRAGAELLGYREGELKGRDVHDTLHHTDRDGAPRRREESPLLRALGLGGDARSGEGDVLWRKDGTPLPVTWSLRPLRDGPRVRGAVLTFTDLTEILAKEEALRRAVRVREEVVSVVSHDLRNPLGVVVGAADLLLDLPLGEEERRQQADVIRRSAERMRSLIENLLDVARIEAGALVVRPAAHPAAVALEETREFFAPQAAERGVRLEVALERGVGDLLADPDRVQQALGNLVVNALRFSRPGGRITLGAASAGPGKVALRVEDEGPGIQPDDLPHVFDRFWQASRHDRTGSGLGLAIVRGIARAHGGWAEVASEPGRGARFTLVLPSGDAAGGGSGPRPVRERARG
jgi:PAS domain S-box-containing protein